MYYVRRYQVPRTKTTPESKYSRVLLRSIYLTQKRRSNYCDSRRLFTASTSSKRSWRRREVTNVINTLRRICHCIKHRRSCIDKLIVYCKKNGVLGAGKGKRCFFAKPCCRFSIRKNAKMGHLSVPRAPAAKGNIARHDKGESF